MNTSERAKKLGHTNPRDRYLNECAYKGKSRHLQCPDLKDVPSQWVSKYFKRLPNGQYQVCDQIRAEVIFRPLNLMEPFPFRKPMDLIFCRNVMIYFDAPTKQQLVQKFYNCTAKGRLSVYWPFGKYQQRAVVLLRVYSACNLSTERMTQVPPFEKIKLLIVDDSLFPEIT